MSGNSNADEIQFKICVIVFISVLQLVHLIVYERFDGGKSATPPP